MTKVVNYKTTLIDKFTDVDEDILKIAVCDLSGIDNSKEHFFSKWNGKASITVSGDLYLDFMESSVTKGKAMHQLQQYFGLSEDECMAFTACEDIKKYAYDTTEWVEGTLRKEFNI